MLFSSFASDSLAPVAGCSGACQPGYTVEGLMPRKRVAGGAGEVRLGCFGETRLEKGEVNAPANSASWVSDTVRRRLVCTSDECSCETLNSDAPGAPGGASSAGGSHEW